jgi:hypothetical protein
VGSPEASLSSKKPKRVAVETVWLQAMLSLKPIRITGMPRNEVPLMFTWPGIVICAW